MLNKIITLGIFSGLFFSSFVLFKEPFEFYIPYIFVIGLLPFFVLKFKFPVFSLKLFVPLLIFGLFAIWSGDNTYPFFFKIYINLFISILFYYYVFVAYEMDLDRLFQYYMIGAYIVCLIGLIQFISFQIGFEFGYNYSLWGLNKWGVSKGGIFGIRLNSILSEPSTIAGSIGPAFFVSLYNLFFKKEFFISSKRSIIIIVVYLLTFSSVAYLGVFLALLLILINKGFIRYVLIIAPIIIGAYYYLYFNVEDFRSRVDGLDELYEGKVKTGYEVHGSSFVQYNNMHIAVQNFKHNPFYGTGLGSHQIAYDRYSLGKRFKVIDTFNKQDANSMFYRIISETGLFGIIFIVWFVFGCFVLKPKGDNYEDYLWLMSSAVLMIILLQLFRQGNYTYNGFMFYMWMYYFVKKEALNRKEKELLTNELSKLE